MDLVRADKKADGSMSGISTGVGLVSGIDTASLVNQLIAIDSRPVQFLQDRVSQIGAQRTAFLTLSAQLLAIRNSVTNLHKQSFFRRFTSESTNDSVLTARADDTAVPGAFTFTVRSLVSNHSLISRGFADANTTPIGLGSISVEVGHGAVNTATDLDTLNGGLGVRRGVITITDRAGDSADVDLRDAVTVEDVLSAINSETAIAVHARVTGVASNGATGDRMVIEDTSGAAATGALSIADHGAGHMAEDLGIAGSGSLSNPARIDGTDLVRLSDATNLSLLNDGNGIGRLFDGNDLVFESNSGAFDFNVSLSHVLASRLDTRLEQLNSGNGVRLGRFRVTDRVGNSAVVDLADPTRPAVTNVADVIARINEDLTAGGVNVSATVINSAFQLSDNNQVSDEVATDLIVKDLADASGAQGFAAADLGIAGSFDTGLLSGRELYRVESVGDLINAINLAPENLGYVHAAISADGNGIVIEAGSEGYTIRAGQASTTAGDLGFADAVLDPFGQVTSHPLIAGMNTVLLDTLRGGSGVTLGEISLTDRAGNTSGPIDFSAARTLLDVVDILNANAPSDPADPTVKTITASINAAGTGLVLRDNSGGTGGLRVQDISGTLAADLGIAVDAHDGDVVDGGNLQRQYISRQTLLADLGGGRGVALGQFRITDSTGAVYVVDPAANVDTVGGMIDVINTATPDSLVARINDHGDGVVIVDSSGGTLDMEIADVDGGTTAADLRLAGTARDGQNFIDGSFETRIEISAGDTLINLIDRLNAAGGDFSASLVNDGGAANPFSLTLASNVSGRRGQLVIDSSGVDFGFSTLSQASDAVIAIGGDGSAAPLLVTGSTNSLEDVLQGVTLDLQSVGSDPVTINVAQDIDGIVESLQSFVSAYNDVQSSIDDLTAVDTETFDRSVLQGDRTVDQIRTRLQRTISRPVAGASSTISRLFQVGITLGANNRLEFDEQRFRDAYEASPRQMEAFFTQDGTGFGAVIQDTLDGLTDELDGLIARKDNLLQDQEQLLNDRIDELNILLAAKRTRLEAQFVAMERALADLQAQQSSLNQLAAITGGASG